MTTQLTHGISNSWLSCLSMAQLKGPRCTPKVNLKWHIVDVTQLRGMGSRDLWNISTNPPILAHLEHMSTELPSPTSLHLNLSTLQSPISLYGWVPVRTSFLALTDQHFRKCLWLQPAPQGTSCLFFPSCLLCFGVSDSYHITDYLSTQAH